MISGIFFKEQVKSGLLISIFKKTTIAQNETWKSYYFKVSNRKTGFVLEKKKHLANNGTEIGALHWLRMHDNISLTFFGCKNHSAGWSWTLHLQLLEIKKNQIFAQTNKCYFRQRKKINKNHHDFIFMRWKK